MNLMNILTAYANEESIAVHVRRRIGLHAISGKNGSLWHYALQLQSWNQTNKTYVLSSIWHHQEKLDKLLYDHLLFPQKLKGKPADNFNINLSIPRQKRVYLLLHLICSC